MKRIFLILLSVILISCSNNAEEEMRDDSAMEFVTSIKIGWNLGNTFDAHSNIDPGETKWGNPSATQALINGVKESGFGAVRIPVTWGQKLDPQLRNRPSDISLTINQIEDLKIDEAWLNRVVEIAGYVRDAGMKAIINIHHDGADSAHWLSVRAVDLTSTNKLKVDAIFKTIWKQIAEKFNDEGEYLIFEGFNELHDGNWGWPGSNKINGVTVTTTSADLIKQRNRINELNQIFVDTIRASDSEYNQQRYLLINGLVASPGEASAYTFTLPKDSADNKLIVSIHCYDPYEFAIQAKGTWGSSDKTNLNKTFNSVKNRFIKYNIPVIIGEYGAVRRSDNTARKNYMEYVTKAAIDRKLIPFYWDNGAFGLGNENFGLLQRSDGKPDNDDSKAVLDAMMKAF